VTSVFAILVHWRGLELIRACLASLARASGPLRTILVDNSPSGEAAALLRREFPEAIAIEPGQNLGFAGGSNAGIRAALERGATHILLLNPDAEVAPDFLAPLLEAASAPRVGIVTGKILLSERPGEPRRIWAAGSRFHAWRGIGLNCGEGEKDSAAFDKARDVDFASGCLFFARREVFERVGLFDERYFCYLEDADLCARARRAGFCVRYEPRAIAFHKVHGSSGGSFEKEGAVTSYYLTRNRLLYARKWLSPARRIFVIAWLFATRAAKIFAELLRGRFGRAHLIVRALWDGIRGRTGAAPAGLLR
jgi:GT2 family glycosyltransferase